MHITYSTVRSSWNSDRIGVCLDADGKSDRKPRSRYFYAERRGNEVSLCGAHGKKHFTFRFDKDVVSAIVKDGFLSISTVDGCVRKYSAVTGKIVSKTWPTPSNDGGRSTVFALAA